MPIQISTLPPTSTSISFMAPYSFVLRNNVKSVLLPPNPHQQIHRQYRQFVEEKQEEQVAHDEDAINSGAQCQQQNEKVTGAPHNRLADQHGAPSKRCHSATPAVRRCHSTQSPG